MEKTYETEIEIGASADQVWDVLVDFPTYGEWNPALPAISGNLAVGETFAMTLGLPGRPSLDVTAVIQTLEEGRGFTWKGNLLSDRMFQGHREFAVSPLGPNRSSFHHVARLTGPLVRPFLLFMDKATAAGHVDFDTAIKARAETLASSADSTE